MPPISQPSTATTSAIFGSRLERAANAFARVASAIARKPGLNGVKISA